MAECNDGACTDDIYLSDLEVESLMKGLDSIKFRLYKCNNLIVPSTFSKQDMELCGMNSFCFATRLLHFKKRWMQQKTNEDETQAVLALLKGLRNNVDFTDVASGFHSEKAAFLEVTKILQCFFRSISLSAMTFNKRDLKKQGISTDKVKLEHLGMGGAEIWRGTPDSRVRGFARDSDVALLPGGEPAGEDSNGTSTAIEAKLQIKKIHLQQLVKTAVVASFIENNRHPDLNTIVPTILIDTTHIVVALYCAKKDLLFISDKTRWRHDTKFNWVGITFLWAMINHRYFLKVIEDRMEHSDKSQIQRHFQERSLLKHFQDLHLKDRIFTGSTRNFLLMMKEQK